jgi:hypothetical protein
VIDCQATAPAPRGHLLEIGWAQVRNRVTHPHACRRSAAARREAFTLAPFDRLRVLTTELKRLVTGGGPVALRLGVGPALDESRLASALWWV